MTNLLVKLSLFFLVITIPFYVSAYPTGAGTCNVDEMATRGHGPSRIQGFGGYSIATSKQGQSLSIKISGSSSSVKGVLLYTIDSNGKETGSFTIPSGYKNCQGQNTLTHTSASSKSLPLTYTWTPSGSSGNVTVRGIVVQDYSNWVKLQELNFDSATGSFTSSNNTSQSGSGSDSGVGSWFKNYLLFVILMIVTIILYIVGSVTETMLKNQRSKAKIYRAN